MNKLTTTRCGTTVLVVAVLAMVIVNRFRPIPEAAGDVGLLAVPIAAAAAAMLWKGRAGGVVAGIGLGVLAVLIAYGVPPVPLLLLSLPAYAAGLHLRNRRSVTAELRRRGEELEREREIVAALACRQERARIAGELHDIVGHAVSVVVVQAAAGQRLARRDEVAARAALAVIAETATDGTRDLLRLASLLDGEATVDGALALHTSIERAVGSGLSVDAQVMDLQRVPAQVSAIAQRVVQEALTNVLRYAPGSAVTIVVQEIAGRCVVEVDNGVASEVGPSIEGTGHGLTGLRERVSAFGGHLHAGPRPGGGWSVRAEVPVSAPAEFV